MYSNVVILLHEATWGDWSNPAAQWITSVHGLLVGWNDNYYDNKNFLSSSLKLSNTRMRSVYRSVEFFHAIENMRKRFIIAYQYVYYKCCSEASDLHTKSIMAVLALHVQIIGFLACVVNYYVYKLQLQTFLALCFF